MDAIDNEVHVDQRFDDPLIDVGFHVMGIYFTSVSHMFISVLEFRIAAGLRFSGQR